MGLVSRYLISLRPDSVNAHHTPLPTGAGSIMAQREKVCRQFGFVRLGYGGREQLARLLCEFPACAACPWLQQAQFHQLCLNSVAHCLRRLLLHATGKALQH